MSRSNVYLSKWCRNWPNLKLPDLCIERQIHTRYLAEVPSFLLPHFSACTQSDSSINKKQSKDLCGGERFVPVQKGSCNGRFNTTVSNTKNSIMKLSKIYLESQYIHFDQYGSIAILWHLSSHEKSRQEHYSYNGKNHYPNSCTHSLGAIRYLWI